VNALEAYDRAVAARENTALEDLLARELRAARASALADAATRLEARATSEDAFAADARGARELRHAYAASVLRDEAARLRGGT
jgi:hypothetical protein